MTAQVQFPFNTLPNQRVLVAQEQKSTERGANTNHTAIYQTMHDTGRGGA